MLSNIRHIEKNPKMIQSLEILKLAACLQNINNFRFTITFSLALGLFVCFVALRPKSTAMVMAGGSVHLNTLFPEQA